MHDDADAKGNTLFGFDLTPDMSEVGAFQLIKQGNLRVEIHFAEALTATISVVMHAEFDNVIEIDRNRLLFFFFFFHTTCNNAKICTMDVASTGTSKSLVMSVMLCPAHR
jgi:hypothetical protein